MIEEMGVRRRASTKVGARYLVVGLTWLYWEGREAAGWGFWGPAAVLFA
jgi:hypothetical protein